jgi:hypothetical protein
VANKWRDCAALSSFSIEKSQNPMKEPGAKNQPLNLPHKLVTARRGLIRIGAVHDEEWTEGEFSPDLKTFVESLRAAPPADIFTFVRPLPECEPMYSFPFDWDNVAVARVAIYNQWWESLPQETRKNVRRSQRRGVTVSRVTFDDQLVRGIRIIYNETPIRQGRKFWHYGKSFEQVKIENASYLERAEFIGAFFEGHLIGFIKFVMVNKVARIMQIVSLEAHSDKRPTNALLAKAVEIAGEKLATHLIYGKYVYGKKENSPVTEFKRRNGFDRLNFPRYYAPLTRTGEFAVRCGLHRELAHFVPERITNLFLAGRAAIYRRRFGLHSNRSSGGQNTSADCSSTEA